MSDQGQINLNWCLALLDGLVSAGVSEIVLSPGSRNTPLTLAAILHPQLTYHVIVDERSAAFFALGLARKSEGPVALGCTSGTAVANWMPGVVEANQQQIPLLLLSADRPWELQQCSANQTIDQIKFFGQQVRAFHQLPLAEGEEKSLQRIMSLGRQMVRQTMMPCPGPVHANLPLREPLVAEVVPDGHKPVPVIPQRDGEVRLDADTVQKTASILSAKPGIIICGPSADSRAILELGDALACPVLADPLSNLRYCSATDAVVHYDLFLRHAQCADLVAEWVLYFGETPVSKPLQTYLHGQAKARHLRVDKNAREMLQGGVILETLVASDQAFCSQMLQETLRPAASAWHQQWQLFEQQAITLLQKLKLPPEGQLIRQALQELPPQSNLFVGNSLTVRFMDTYSGRQEKNFSVFGNRGASGIDGNLSTLSGIASASPATEKVLGIMGDLSLFHDLNSLATARNQDMILLLFNNHGGGIFDYLPQVSLPDYEACWRTPVTLDHEHIAKAFHIAYVKVEALNEFEALFTKALQSPGMQLIEIMVDSAESNRRHRTITDSWKEP